MENSPDRENSQGRTENRVTDDTVHKHGTQELSSAEDAAAAASSVRGALERMSAPERLEVEASKAALRCSCDLAHFASWPCPHTPTRPLSRSAPGSSVIKVPRKYIPAFAPMRAMSRCSALSH